MSRQRIRDPIHDLIVFPDDDEGRTLWSLLETEPVQRLRRIKQLGFSEFVYPGASHKRLSHSLGAMQMARRMLESFTKRDAIEDFDEQTHETWRLATLCAALLHDIGHGPYSHVFEELSELQGSEVGHEEYTKSLIEGTEIASILDNAAIKEKTLYFFTREKQSNPYGSIISSQMDCDRLDFLSRDRYFTGIRSSVVDLEWLFDSLRVEKVYTDVVGDAFEYALVVDGKGKRVIEEFVGSYTKMYKDVYLHKTTRSMQHIATHAMSEALNELNKKEIKSDKMLSTLSEIRGGPINIERYLTLDDSAFTSSIGYIRDLGKGRSGMFAERYLRRVPLKCLEISKRDSIPEKMRSLRDALNEKNVWYHLDIVKEKGYKQYSVADRKFTENIIIRIDGVQRRLHEIGHVEQANGHSLRFYFEDDGSKATAVQLLKSI